MTHNRFNSISAPDISERGTKSSGSCSCCEAKTWRSKAKSNSSFISKHLTGSHTSLSTMVYCVVLLLLCICVPLAYCDTPDPGRSNQTLPQPGANPEDAPDTEKPSRAIDRAMRPLYTMTNGFLNLIQPVSKGLLLEEADLVNDVGDGRIEVIILSMEDWEMWMEHYVGFVVCAILGLLFILVLPFGGLCFCCCRCCGHCGGRSDMEEKKGDRCRRGVCGALLALFTLIVLAGMVCGFVTNELLREQTLQDEDRAIANTLTMELTSLNNFKDNTVTELRQTILTSLDDTTTEITNNIRNAANNAKDDLAQLTNSVEIFRTAIALAETARDLNTSLSLVKVLSDQLVVDRGVIISNLSRVRNDLTSALANCPNPACVDKRQQVNSLDVLPNYAEVDDVSNELVNLQAVLDSDLARLITEGKTEMDDIADKLKNDISGDMNEYVNEFLLDATNKVNEVKEQVHTEINKIVTDLDQFYVNTSIIKQYQDDIETYGTYRYYGGIAMCCLLLLVVLFFLLGLCFGICGDAPSDGATACNRGVGATVMLVGVGFVFLFMWLLMIVVLLVFLLGGLSYTEMCRYAVNLTNAPMPVRNTVDEIVSIQIQSLELDIKVTQVLRDCQDNYAIFQSLNLGQKVNITQKLDIKNYGIPEIIQKMVNNSDVDLSNVVIFSNETKVQLQRLSESGLEEIDFESYSTQMEMQLVSTNLTVLATDLDVLADNIGATQPNVAAELRDGANQLRAIETSSVATMVTHVRALAPLIASLTQTIHGPPSINQQIAELTQALETAQSSIQSNGTILIKQFIQKHGEEIIEDLGRRTSELAYTIENEVGRCRPVARSLDNIATATCVTLLDPFNGFWFAMGMCLFFLVPLIFMAVYLSSLYRKTDEYYDDKSFDDVNYDAYNGVYPGDNIPLEEHFSRPRLY